MAITQRELEPPLSKEGAMRDPAKAPPASPASESALVTSPLRRPVSAETATTASAIQSTVATPGSLAAPSASAGGYNAASQGA